LKTGIWLGIETSSTGGGAALVEGGGSLIGEFILPIRASSSERLLPSISDLLATTGLDGSSIAGIGVSVGPGSYTGLRIGVATAMGLSAGWKVGVKGVSTLRALAFSCCSTAPVLAALRARQGEVFAAVYASSDPFSEALVEEGIYEAGSLAGALPSLRLGAAVGSGRSELPRDGAIWVDPLADCPRPSGIAAIAARLAEAAGFDTALSPVYLRSFRQKASPVVH
jgi:tRNA threonylcarbamoyladenosine biosynthesis protein TsaB